jgi:hypothetical protein
MTEKRTLRKTGAGGRGIIVIQTLFTLSFRSVPRNLATLRRLISCALPPCYTPVAFGKDFSSYRRRSLTLLEMTMAECLNDRSLSCHSERNAVKPKNPIAPLIILSAVRHGMPSVRRRIPSVYCGLRLWGPSSYRRRSLIPHTLHSG